MKNMKMNKYKTRATSKEQRNRYGQGWFLESARHSLARRGISTYRKESKAYKKAYQNVLKREKINPFSRDFTSISQKSREFSKKLGDEYKKVCVYKKSKKFSGNLVRKYHAKKVSYSKIDYSLMNNLQSFLHNHFSMKVTGHPRHVQESEEVVSAREDIEKITNWQKFRDWTSKHKKTIIYLGLGGLIGIAGATAGVPTLMQNQATGEIIAVGGTFIGKYGMIGQTILTGFGVMEEVKVIDKDVQKQLLEENLIRPEDIRIETKEPQALIIKVKKSPLNFSNLNFSNENLDDSDYGDLSELSSKPIPYSELTEKEKRVLFTAVKKVKKLFKRKNKDIIFTNKNLQVCNRVGPDNTAFGAHQDDLIQINRNILKDADKTEGVLAHETLHKVYNVRDETRDLENLQIDFMGELL